MEEMDYEKEEMHEHEHEGSAFSTLLKTANLAASAFAVLRYFDRYIDGRSVMRWMGFSRRRSFWGSAALFGAGAVAGAGIALFVSPVSGQQTRQGMLRGFRNIGRKGRELIESSGISQIAGIGQGEHGEQSQQGREQGQQGREQGQQGREQGQQGREQGQQGREGGMRVGGEQKGGGEANRPGSEASSGANRGEGGKQLNR